MEWNSASSYLHRNTPPHHISAPSYSNHFTPYHHQPNHFTPHHQPHQQPYPQPHHQQPHPQPHHQHPQHQPYAAPYFPLHTSHYGTYQPASSPDYQHPPPRPQYHPTVFYFADSDDEDEFWWPQQPMHYSGYSSALPASAPLAAAVPPAPLKPLELMTPIERTDASTVWKEFSNWNGEKYYYNEVTKQYTWTIPEELQLAREQEASHSMQSHAVNIDVVASMGTPVASRALNSVTKSEALSSAIPVPTAVSIDPAVSLASQSPVIPVSTMVVPEETTIDEDGAKIVEAIEETIIAATAPTEPMQEVAVNARVDWKETLEAHLFKADLPGLKEEMKVEVENAKDADDDVRSVHLDGQLTTKDDVQNLLVVEFASKTKSRTARLPRITEKVDGRWEVGVSLSEGQFQQECKSLSLWTNMFKFTTNAGLGPPLENEESVFSDTGWYATNKVPVDGVSFVVGLFARGRMRDAQKVLDEMLKLNVDVVPGQYSTLGAPLAVDAVLSVVDPAKPDLVDLHDEIEFITKTLNCLPIIERLRAEKLGYNDLVEEVSLGDGKIMKITGIKDMGRTSTVLVRGSHQLVLDEADGSLHDALCVVRSLVNQRFLIAIKRSRQLGAVQRPISVATPVVLNSDNFSVLNSERDRIEKQLGWTIKTMQTAKPSPMRDKYALVIFPQKTVSHLASVDMMSGGENRKNIVRTLRNLMFHVDNKCKEKIFADLTISLIEGLINDVESSVQEQALAMVRILVEGSVSNIDFAFEEDSAILNAVGRHLQKVEAVEVQFQVMCVLSNVASGTELHKNTVMHKVAPVALSHKNSIKFLQNVVSQPEEIDNLERKRIQLEVELHALEKEKGKASKARLAEVKQELDDLRDKLQPRMMKYRRLKQKRKKLLIDIHEAERRSELARVADIKYGSLPEVGSRPTGIPVTRLGQNDKERLVELADRLHKRIVGQDQAVEAAAKAVLRSRAGLGRPQQPTGSFLFLGPTGVGTKELAKVPAEQPFDDENLLVRIDMTKYMEQHFVARLIGGPPGYIGHEESVPLNKAVRRRPYSVVLFDEVEKVRMSVFNTPLQVLEDGRLTDGQDRTVDFSNTVIIMTSNLGAEHLLAGLLGKGTMQAARDRVRVMQEFQTKYPELNLEVEVVSDGECNDTSRDEERQDKAEQDKNSEQAKPARSARQRIKPLDHTIYNHNQLRHAASMLLTARPGCKHAPNSNSHGKSTQASL